MTGFAQDLRYTLRALRNNLGFAAIAVITLALGIGANTVMFSVVNAVLLEAAPFRHPQRLVMVWERNFPRNANTNVVGPANYLRWREQNQSFEDLGAFIVWPMNLLVNGEAQRVPAAIATPSLFSTLGVNAAVGRTFLPQEEQPGKDNVVLLSYAYWQQRFGGDPAAVGKDVVLNGTAVKIVGVMPPRFSLFDKADVWTPLTYRPELRNPRGRYLTVVARLKPGVTVAQAQADMDVVASHTRAELTDWDAGWGVTIVPLREQMVGGLRRALMVLLGTVAFVLLIACANVANLLLAKASAREKEIAIRTALGVSRWRLIRQLLTESMVLAITGGIAGVVLAYWSLRAVLTLVPATMPGYADIRLNLPVLAFTLAVSMLTGLLFGIVPALRAARTDPHEALKEGGRGTSAPGRHRVRNVLVVVEAATALVLLIGAGVLLRSFVRLMQVDTGFQPEGVLTMQVTLASDKYRKKPQIVQFFQQAVEEVRRVPGVTAAAAISWLPFDGGGSATDFTFDDRPEPKPGERPVADVRSVTEDYFRAMGIALLRGRTFDPTQDRAEDKVKKIVVNQSMADIYWPGQDPLGKTIHMDWDGMLQAQVIGVVSDIHLFKLDSLSRRATLYWYLPQFPTGQMTVVARTRGDPKAFIGNVKSQLASLDPEIPVAKIRTMSSVVAETVREPRFTMLLLVIFAALALTLAGIGLYGVISYSVTQRQHELGIRMALGARPDDVWKMVVREGMRLTTLGAAIGIVAALALAQFLSTLVFGVSARDVLTFVLVPLVICGVGLLACYLPARRATRVDPMMALRYE